MHKAKERLARMERRHLIAACVVVVLVAAAIVATTIILVANTQKPVPHTTADFSVSGVMTCLPHKNTNGPQTLECAYGLHTDDDRYYGLQYSPFPNDTQIGDHVNVKGTLTTGGDSIYNIVGTIKVHSITKR